MINRKFNAFQTVKPSDTRDWLSAPPALSLVTPPQEVTIPSRDRLFRRQSRPGDFVIDNPKMDLNTHSLAV